MRNCLIPLFCLPVFLILTATGEINGEVETGGFLETGTYFDINRGAPEGNTYARLRWEAKTEISSNIFSLISLDLRYYNFPGLEELSSVNEIESSYPLDLLLWEAYLEITQFVWSNLDLKVGKQRIAWGTADKFNPTDNLNPGDFLDLGGKLPTYALKADYYLGDYIITGVWLPYFEPVHLPRGGVKFLFGLVPDKVNLPDKTWQNSMFGLKLKGIAFNWDYSLSYFSGYDELPVYFVENGKLEIGFPRMEVIGFDFAGEIRSVGVWGEAGFFREKEESGSVPGFHEEQFLKYTLGMDYTFENGIYAQAQYVHGFIMERGRDNLHDYLTGKVEKRLLNDEITLSLSGILEAKEMGDIAGSYATGFFPEITYRPVDNLQFILGAFFLNGKRGTLLGDWKEFDQVYFKITVDF